MTEQESEEYETRLSSDPIAKRLREFGLNPDVVVDETTSLKAIIGIFVARLGTRLARRWAGGTSA
jgi:hypothetical protein